ncbi:unnamed protein product [Urochloa humidicola]
MSGSSSLVESTPSTISRIADLLLPDGGEGVHETWVPRGGEGVREVQMPRQRRSRSPAREAEGGLCGGGRKRRAAEPICGRRAPGSVKIDGEHIGGSSRLRLHLRQICRLAGTKMLLAQESK